MQTGWIGRQGCVFLWPPPAHTTPIYWGNCIAASPAMVTFSGIIKALFCPKETKRRINFFWSTCLWILSAVITGIYVLPQMHCHWTLRAAIGSRCGNQLGNTPENEGSERLSSLLKVTQAGYKVRRYKEKKIPFEIREIWVLICALLINI